MRTISNLIDPTVSKSPISEILRCIHIGLLCVQENIVDDRPNMASIGFMNTVALPLPIHNLQVSHRAMLY